ncbi:hypothetical protein S83_010641, partial [Arachis hypogaea]
ERDLATKRCFIKKKTNIQTNKEVVIKLGEYSDVPKRHSNIPAHISSCTCVKKGDHVIVGQC